MDWLNSRGTCCRWCEAAGGDPAEGVSGECFQWQRQRHASAFVGCLKWHAGAFTTTKGLMQVLLLVQQNLLASSVQKYLLTVVDMQAAADESYTVTTSITITKVQILTRLLLQKYKFWHLPSRPLRMSRTPLRFVCRLGNTWTLATGCYSNFLFNFFIFNQFFDFLIEVREHVDTRHRLLMNSFII